MEKGNPAAFQLVKFAIPQFSITQPEAKYSTIDIILNPAGSYNSLKGEYQLILVFIADAINQNDLSDKKQFVSGSLIADYIIEGKPKHPDIPDYFYQNSLAIVFPYLRAFVSNITLQAGLPLLILPLLNLTHLTENLKINTKVFE